jgi:hypothetical protein
MGATEEFAGDLVAWVLLLLGVVCGRGVLGVVVALADQLGRRHNPACAGPVHTRPVWPDDALIAGWR